MENRHKTVLLNESIEGLALKAGATILDATLGGAGHSLGICKKIGAKGTLIGLDADADAIARAEDRLASFQTKKILREVNFRHIADVLEEEGIREIDGALFDLGWSQNQLELSGRGFSFQRDEPLLMTFSKNGEDLTAYEIVNRWSEEDLKKILREYGEENFSGRIVRGIIETREEKPIETTFELVRAIEKNVPGFYRSRKIHAATKTFQALRIAVNQEFDVLTEGLTQAFAALAPHGKLVVISFHSIEDRIVKLFFKEKAKEGVATILTKKPKEASEQELRENPRARSAKLRILEKN
jgi:16S rRNA (cytosine1402-N4)-methyltransferase